MSGAEPRQCRYCPTWIVFVDDKPHEDGNGRHHTRQRCRNAAQEAYRVAQARRAYRRAAPHAPDHVVDAAIGAAPRRR